MKIKTAELVDQALDWAVDAAQKHGYAGDYEYTSVYQGHDCKNRTRFFLKNQYGYTYAPTDKWDECAKLMQRYSVYPVPTQYIRNDDGSFAISKMFSAKTPADVFDFSDGSTGETPLIAVCRSIVRSEMGEEIEVPDWLFPAKA